MTRAKRGVTLQLFYKGRGWNPRAAYRDVDTLRAAGIPVENRRGIYWIPESWIPAGTVDVKRDEMLALYVARHLAPGLRGTAIGQGLDSLSSKLTPSRQTTLPLGDEAAIRGPETAAIDLGPHRAELDVMREAASQRRVVRIRYRKPTGDEQDRAVEPSFLYWDPEAETFYVRAYCRERAAFRTFAAHRIVSAAPLEEPFARRPDPEWNPARGFRAWHGASVEHVSIRFSPAVAGEICERRWQPSQQLTRTPDGGVVLEMDVSVPEALDRWLLGWGADAEVQAPAWLAERVRQRHAEAAGLRAGPLPSRRSGPSGAAPAAAMQSKLAANGRGSVPR